MKIRDAVNPMYWANRMIDKRITNYGKGVGTEMKYNPLLVTIPSVYNDKHMTRRLLENSVWYSGIEQDIQYFYRKEAPKFYRHGEASESLNYFWANNDDKDFRRIHSGFPQLISEKMVDLIVGNGYDILVDGDNQEDLQNELTDMLDDNKFKALLGKGIETESWSGGTAWKLSYNPMISDYPIIEVWQPENYTNVVKCGRIIEDIFYTYYDKDNMKYRLSEIYGVDRTNGAYIDYKLHMLQYDTHGQVQGDAKWNDAKLSDLEQTKDLKRLEFKGYFNKLSLYKPNKTPNSEFRYSVLGESDYAGSYGAFDAVDEIISTWIQEFRDGKLNRYFPEEYVPKTSNGDQTFGTGFKKDHIIYADSPSENVDKQKIMYEQGDIRTEKHVESYKIWVTQILNNAGLSPLTVGITGLESIDASAESQQEREKVSIRTRNKKIELWQEFLQDFIKTALEFKLMMKNANVKEDEVNIGTIPEFNIQVTFEDYIIKSMKDRTSEVTEGNGIVWDTLTAVRYVHKDKTPKQQLAISARIKIANGDQTLSQAEASALQDENLFINEELQEDGVELLVVNDLQNNTVIDETEVVPPTEDET